MVGTKTKDTSNIEPKNNRIDSGEQNLTQRLNSQRNDGRGRGFAAREPEAQKKIRAEGEASQIGRTSQTGGASTTTSKDVPKNSPVEKSGDNSET